MQQFENRLNSTYRTFLLVLCFLQSKNLIVVVDALKVVIAGGTGRLGSSVASQLYGHKVMLLSRNAHLATAATSVNGGSGCVGKLYLNENPHVAVRDWDGGVGSNCVGWQDDALKGADVIVNLVGDYTPKRVMATERLVQESKRLNPQALQITVSPKSGDSVRSLVSGAYGKVEERLEKCEEMVKGKCLYSKCLRLDGGKQHFRNNVEEIVNAITEDEDYYYY